MTQHTVQCLLVALMLAVPAGCSWIGKSETPPAATTPTLTPTPSPTPDLLAGAKKLKQSVTNDMTAQQVTRAMGEPDDKRSWVIKPPLWRPFEKPTRGTTYFYAQRGRVVFNEAGRVASVEPNPNETGMAPEKYP